MNQNRLPCYALAVLALFGAGCGGSKKPLIVGSKNTTVQVVLAEIVAQHLEHRLGRKVERRLSLGNSVIAYQALAAGQISLYPEETGTIEATILRERAAQEPSAVLERVRIEMQRTAQMEVLDPLGVENPWVLLTRADDSANTPLDTIGDAALAKTGWKLGVTPEFQDRPDGLAALNAYRLPMSAPPRSADAGTLYAAFEKGELTMIAGTATDAQVATHTDWKILRDDLKVFPPYQTCLMARADVLAGDPRIRLALAELSGKFTTAMMGKLAARVDIDHRTAREASAEFFAQAGLK